MHLMPRKLLFFLLLIWIGLLSLPISLLQFNKYEGISAQILMTAILIANWFIMLFAVLLLVQFTPTMHLDMAGKSAVFPLAVVCLAIAVAILACGNATSKDHRR